MPTGWWLEYELELERVQPAVDWSRAPVAERIEHAYLLILICSADSVHL